MSKFQNEIVNKISKAFSNLNINAKLDNYKQINEGPSPSNRVAEKEYDKTLQFNNRVHQKPLYDTTLRDILEEPRQLTNFLRKTDSSWSNLTLMSSDADKSVNWSLRDVPNKTVAYHKYDEWIELQKLPKYKTRQNNYNAQIDATIFEKPHLLKKYSRNG